MNNRNSNHNIDEPTMLPQSRQERRQVRKNDGTSRDRAIREMPDNMPDFDAGNAQQQDPRHPQSSQPQRPAARRQPPPPPRAPQPPAYDEVVGAPPQAAPQRPSSRAQRPPEPQAPAAARPQRPQMDLGTQPQNFRSGGMQERPAAVPQSGQGVRFDSDQAAQRYGEDGYANFEEPEKRGKKGRRRKKRGKKKNVQLSDQKRDVGESIDLRDDTSRLIMRFSPDVVDNLRGMTTRLMATSGSIPSRIAMLSPLPGEGTTYVSRALATVMAHDMSARIAYVDLTWWSPGQPVISRNTNQGLVSVVTGDKRLDEIFVNTSMRNLTLIPAGHLERGDRPIMARSSVLQSAIDVLDRHFDHIVFDVPSIRATNDAIPLASLANGVVMVIKQGVTTNETVRLALDEVAHLNMLGVLLNQVNYRTPAFLRRLIPQD